MARAEPAVPIEAHSAYLLDLFRKDVAQKLEAEAIEAIRPKIRSVVEEAMKSLKGSIESHYNLMEMQTVVRLQVNGEMLK